MSAGHVCGIRGSGIVSSAAHVLWMSVIVSRAPDVLWMSVIGDITIGFT